MLNYQSDDALTYRSEYLAFSILALLAILDIAAYLFFARRAPVRAFFSLSIFVLGEDRKVYASLVNVCAIACTIAACWVVFATLIFPTETAFFAELVYDPCYLIWSRFDPQFNSSLEVPFLVTWMSLFGGIVWVPLFAFCLSLTLKTCFAIHVSLSQKQDFLRCERASIKNRTCPQ